MLAGLRLTQRLVEQEPLASILDENVDMFTKPKSMSRFQNKGALKNWSDSDLLDLCRETAFTI